MILVDCSVWVDYFRGVITPQPEILDGLLGHEPLAIGDLTLAEVLQGFAGERDFKKAHRLLTTLLIVEIGGREIALQAARNYRLLRRHGAPFARRSIR